jgi:hypothetical protein
MQARTFQWDTACEDCVNLSYRDGRGRTRLISLRYDPGRVLEALR